MANFGLLLLLSILTLLLLWRYLPILLRVLSFIVQAICSWVGSITYLTSPNARLRSNPRNRPRMSRSPSSIKTEYDVVVIGSGYGGGVAASRMARAGKRVCVLEKGAERWPGEFPHTFRDSMREYRVSGRVLGKDFTLGKDCGLYHTVKGEGQDVFQGSGLGGTSLINAGVFLRAKPELLASSEWPEEIRKNIQDLDQYYDRAEKMLQPTCYPSSTLLPLKAVIFENQAKQAGVYDRFYRTPLTTFFQPLSNSVGIRMNANAGSGNECTGANDGSKSSVLVTYLADAWAWGAELFCGVEAKYVQRMPDQRYIVYYDLLSQDGLKQRMWVRARELVFLGAGALSTTEILLRSRQHGLRISPLLGQRINGNGDMLSFAYNCKENVGSVGRESTSCSQRKSGPTITSCIDMRNTDNPVRDGYVVQEGTIPEALAPVIQALLESQKAQLASRSYRWLQGLIPRLKSWVLGAYIRGGSIDRTLVFLTMFHDANQGRMTLDKDKSVLQWSGPGATKSRKRIDNLLLRMTEALGGILVEAPCLTVHPLGGAVMRKDGTGLGGVVNHYGQLLNGTSGEVHEGIVCVDSSVIPTSLGVNPCATITALAERACATILNRRGWRTNETRNSPIDPGNPMAAIGLYPLMQNGQKNRPSTDYHETDEGVQFEEVLVGYLDCADCTAGFDLAASSAKQNSSAARLSLTVDASRSHHGFYTGKCWGTLVFPKLSSGPLIVQNGCVDFFTSDPDVSDATNMIYSMDLEATTGETLRFRGFKRLDSAAAFSISDTWRAMTTLYTTITNSSGTIVAKGILHLPLRGFISEIASLHSRSPDTALSKLRAQARFFSFFARHVASYTFSNFRSLQYPTIFDHETGHFPKPYPSTTTLISEDGANIPLKIWEPAFGTPVKDMPILLIPGAAVDENLFALPTVQTNTIDYFTLRGYRCYVVIPRFASTNAARRGDTVYDARLDIRAALDYVRGREAGRRPYVVAHCLGSIATGIALLTGDVPASWIQGLTISQVFINLHFSWDNAWKAKSGFLLKTYQRLAGNWFSCHSSPSSPWFQYILDQALRFYPVGSRSEICNSTVCHRCDVPFGRCWTHANLNRATHTHLGEVFDGTHINFMTQLTKMGSMPLHHVRTNQPEMKNLVTEENLARLEGLNICFLNGAENAVWSPRSAKTSYDLLRETFPSGQYERFEVEGYGHMDCWIGKRASEDVFPRVEHHLKACIG